jgi:hypothetical protein
MICVFIPERRVMFMCLSFSLSTRMLFTSLLEAICAVALFSFSKWGETDEPVRGEGPEPCCDRRACSIAREVQFAQLQIMCVSLL